MVLRHINARDQQADDARLPGREQLFPQRRQVGDRLDDVTLWMASSISCFAAAHVRAMISGVRSRCRTWATTASSISAAGTLRTGQSA